MSVQLRSVLAHLEFVFSVPGTVLVIQGELNTPSCKSKKET